MVWSVKCVDLRFLYLQILLKDAPDFFDVDTLKFLGFALGSLSELKTQLIISQNLNIIKKDCDNIMMKVESVKKMLLGLVKYLKNK